MSDRELVLERKDQEDTSEILPGVMLTPNGDEDYWCYRVQLSEKQAIIGFPKFLQIGIGFAQEEDWNTNLPASMGSMQIFEHIKHNKGDEEIEDADVIRAIEMIQQAAADEFYAS